MSVISNFIVWHHVKLSLQIRPWEAFRILAWSTANKRPTNNVMTPQHGVWHCSPHFFRTQDRKTKQEWTLLLWLSPRTVFGTNGSERLSCPWLPRTWWNVYLVPWKLMSLILGFSHPDHLLLCLANFRNCSSPLPVCLTSPFVFSMTF